MFMFYVPSAVSLLRIGTLLPFLQNLSWAWSLISGGDHSSVLFTVKSSILFHNLVGFEVIRCINYSPKDCNKFCLRSSCWENI